MNAARLTIFGCLLLALAHPVSAASFDCSKAATFVEQTICQDPATSTADSMLIAAYKKVLAVSSYKELTQSSQRAWLDERNACQDLACIKTAYEERLVVLDKIIAYHSDATVGYLPLVGAVIPTTGNSVGQFIPAGRRIEGQSQGDLNGDGFPDVIVSLGDFNLVLLKQKGGGYHRLPVECLLSSWGLPTGLYGFIEVHIDRATLLVSRGGGSRDVYTTTWRFRYEPKSKRFTLVGQDDESYDRVTAGLPGTLTSLNYLTGEKRVENYRYRRGKRVVTSSQKSHGLLAKRYIEDVDSGLREECYGD